ncbi:unnamed protein product [Dracunculus medinensis]|uniref:Protein regulator of cytokinesis 1 n=1 Tax=Dracunculus medinensis TaxID=318479 RepID=A0A0N4UMA2_DRAME|nr:unnamed protein product [Dracunculus medinensis]
MKHEMSSSRRRISVDLSTAEAVGYMHETMDRLNELWDSIHMGENERRDRVDRFYMHIKSLLDDMVKSESDMVRDVLKSIDEWIPFVNNLRKELKLHPFDTSHFKKGSVSLLRALNKERARLISLKTDRLKGQKELIDEAKLLSTRLGEDFFNVFGSDNEEIWNDDQLHSLQDLVTRANAKLNERIEEICQWQTDLQRWYKQMEKQAENEATETLIKLNLDDTELVISGSFMEQFREAYQMEMLVYQDWLEMAQFDYSEAWIKLNTLWEMCHIESGKHFARDFNPAIHTAGDVENIKNEVDKLEKLLVSRGEIYKKIKEWKELWTEKINYESSANDKMRYHNRGGQLQIALQRQKWIASRLPHLEREIGEANNKYAESHPNDPIILDGLSPVEYVRNIITEYKTIKELERLKKRKACHNQTLNQTGQKFKTPRKHDLPAGFATPAKTRKIDSTINRIYKMGATPSRHPLGSVFPSTSSLHSAITPVRPLACGPKTSSPKGLKKRKIL